MLITLIDQSFNELLDQLMAFGLMWICKFFPSFGCMYEFVWLTKISDGGKSMNASNQVLTNLLPANLGMASLSLNSGREFGEMSMP